MNSVTQFMKALVADGDEESGNIRRQLSVCAEFERIAKVVLEKSDSESNSRRKRKNYADDGKVPPEAPKPQPGMSKGSPAIHGGVLPTTPQSQQGATVSLSLYLRVYEMWSQVIDIIYPPQSHLSPTMSQNGWMSEFSPGNAMPMMSPNIGNSGPELAQFATGNPPMFDSMSFDQSFQQQDIWPMPMTFEYDWTDLSAAVGNPDITSPQPNHFGNGGHQ
jgi:hypothetical protein